uniref:SnoaB n=1 Tax=Streptomyces nogalater TaxID=38314 RepID=UPI0001C39802|nr:Chain A, SnoaB [Streptomyces nogalater]3KG1_B Chain B, SnoaB [Streptomyces nogalater]3KG1_C Chain C, SnoaB [Streptomyces nogalater]
MAHHHHHHHRSPTRVNDGVDADEVTFVNRFTVHGAPAEFESVFARTAAFFARQPGFVRHTLLRERDKDNSYVAIAVWTDHDAFRRALAQPGFLPHATALRALSTSEHGLFTARQTLPEGGDTTGSGHR